jgi:hypothetical protein
MGLLLEVIAIVGLGLSISITASAWVLAAWLFLYGAGVGLATAQLTSVILAEVPVAQSGQASGLQSTFRQLGSALGIALLGTLLVTSLGAKTSNGLTSVANLDPAAQKNITAIVKGSAGAAIPQLSQLPNGAAVKVVAQNAMVSAARLTTLLAAAVILFGLLATIALPAGRKEEAKD